MFEHKKQLLHGHDVNNEKVINGEIQTHVQCGLSPVLINSSGAPWTADYVTVTEDSKLYFNLSNPGSEHEAPNPTPPSFQNPRR